MRGETLRQDSPKLSINDILSDTELHSLWQRIGESLQLFKSKAVKVTGATKQPTGKTAMRLPGHEQLHRE
eukprot:582224-Rhodomonas_salina.1